MMSQRHSGYERIPGDQYQTPSWVTMALEPHMPGVFTALEPAEGQGRMVAALRTWDGMRLVSHGDISNGYDFLAQTECKDDAVITNPPYLLAERFIWHALHLTRPQAGRVAMLLRTDFDHAKSRRPLFGECKAFAKKLVLTKRIRWIEGSTGAPSFNHAWFIWDWRNDEPAVIAYHYDEETTPLTRLQRLRALKEVA